MKLNFQRALNAGYSKQEIEQFAKEKGATIYNREGVGTFLKSAAEATGIPKSLANIGAAATTGVGGVQMLLNKPEAAEKSFNTALNLRKYAGTEGSFDQGFGSGMKTLGKGGLEAGKTALTAIGLKAPISTLKNTAIPSTLIGGTVSKLTGGTFSEGAGSGFGGTPAIVGAGTVIKNVATSKPVKDIVSKTKEIAGKVGEKVSNKSIDLLGETGNKIQSTQEKTSLLTKISKRKETIAKTLPKTKYHTFLDDLVKEANKTINDPDVRERVVKKILKEKASSKDTISFLDFLTKKSNATFNRTSTTSSNMYNNLFKESAKKIIHNTSGQIEKLDNAYWLIKQSGELPGQILRKLGIPVSILLGSRK